MYSIAQINKIVGGQFLCCNNSSARVEHLLTDSRKVLFTAHTLFFAITGKHRQGNNFVQQLYNKGLQNFIVEEGFVVAKNIYSTANIIAVKNVVQALQTLAQYHRHKFSIPIIGITGSNGKTIVKEWLHQLLQANYNIVRNPKSYNSQIGVPLSIWQINATHNLGIFEAGISQPSEMENLQKIINPTIGIFTNIGDAHNQGFLSTQQKTNEKLKLFINSHLLVYGADNKDLKEAVATFKKNYPALNTFTWGKNLDDNLQIISIKKNISFTTLTALHQQAQMQCSIPFTDDAAIENAMHCWCILLYFKISPAAIAERMSKLSTVEMRLELKQGIHNCSIINDSYSSDINSLTIALDFLVQQQQHPKRTLILSDILQSGKNSFDLYNQVAVIVQQKKIDRFIGVGAEIFLHQNLFKNISEAIFFPSTDLFKQNFSALNFNNETILLKGARVFEFEQITHLLEQQMHQTVLEINLNALAHNLKQYQQLLNPGVKIMAMVKAFSYGSGSFEIANLMQFYQVDYLAVAYADEGVELRRSGILLPIMVMNAEPSTFDKLVQNNLEPEIFSFEILQSFKNYLQQCGIINYPVHIKLDTGMHRLGFEMEDIPALCKLLTSENVFKIQSVFSHLAASDSPLQDEFTQQQFQLFVKACALLKENIFHPFLMHIANTAAIYRHKNLQLNMVRLGIGLYGIDSNAAMQKQLQNVTTLKTTIAQIKKIKAGDSIGYSRKAIATKDLKIATVRIGYADGYPRCLSNGVGKMSVGKKMAPVIGNICMDMTMLDITDIDAQEGDEVIVFGENLPVTHLAQWANTIPYEILTGLSQRVKRVYFQE